MTANVLPDSAPPVPSLPRYDQPPRLAGSQVVLLQQTDDPASAAVLAERLSLSADALQVLVADAPQAGAALLECLAGASVGLQLLLSGDEAYLWPLHALARQAGLRPEEIHLLNQGEARRTIYCVHCTALQSGGPAEQHDCQQCGVRLEVRRHFSHRLGAYLGVCADADHPYAEGRP
ncbi:dimethylamine monooxygenase subunit DmmA family protein [Pseudomonas sp. QE6]|uniref:dimethylamine monooxygenase subunit DmmA family protein n=1 Tax=Pseudomonas sp. QE6 TaxID=3242491 RepID=UPI003528B065